MKNIGLEIEHMFDTYIKEIRSVLELVVPAWHSGLTLKQCEDIEWVQKIAFKIILGVDYYNYNVACTILESDTLKNRRKKLCLKFAQKDLKKDNTMFNKITHPNYNHNRFKNSCRPYLARLLNQSD